MDENLINIHWKTNEAHMNVPRNVGRLVPKENEAKTRIMYHMHGERERKKCRKLDYLHVIITLMLFNTSKIEDVGQNSIRMGNYSVHLTHAMALV